MHQPMWLATDPALVSGVDEMSDVLLPLLVIIFAAMLLIMGLCTIMIAIICRYAN